MEEEYFLTGYCRQMDSGRTVTLETDGRQLTHLGCGYHSCQHKEQCPIGKQICQLLEAQRQ